MLKSFATILQNQTKKSYLRTIAMTPPCARQPTYFVNYLPKNKA
jgi:hypothetical protein